MKAYLKYSSQGQLTNIQDVVGLNSGMEYTNGNLGRLFTPYGTTTFTYLATNGAQAIRVEEHGLRRHLWLGGFNATNVLPTATNESSELRTFLGSHLGGQSVPETVEAGSFHERNTFYWGPRQYANLPSTIRTALTNGTFNPASLTTNNFKLGWTKHWLRWSPGSGTSVYPSPALSLERAPSESASGTTEGLLTWYDYAGKVSDTTAGNQSQPRLVASREAGGEWRVTYTERNALGNPVLVKDKFTVPVLDLDVLSGWTWDWRTNAYTYAANGVDMLTASFNGVTEMVYFYNAFHQVISSSNVLAEETTFEYNASQQLTNMVTPSGLILTYTYDGNGFPATVVERNATIAFSTNAYTWSNGRLATSTSERGVTVNYEWDALGRLLKKTYPDSTFVTNIYQNLDVLVSKDRLGFTSGVAYNSFRQVLRQTNALGRVTTLTYCNCGSLETVTDALSQQTSFTYDNLGRRVRTTLPGGSWSENTYDVLNQVTRVTDNAGSAVTNTYNLQGLLHYSRTAHGYLSYSEYDAEDRATNTLGANAVTFALNYDALGRLTWRRPSWWPWYVPEEVGEGFFYSARGLVAQSNQLGHFTLFAYDELGRKTAETNANSEVTQFKYDLSGNLTNLIDGKGQNTFWRYDEYSRVTNKTDHAGNVVFAYRYDANGRLTARWTPAKGDTGYTNDAAGNLTLINYSNSTDIALGYDAVNRLTNMTDAVGTTRFTYTAFGALLTEDGPWASDTVSYAYTSARQRQSLSLAQPSAAAWAQTYAYDAARRLTNTTSPAGAFGYAYKATQFAIEETGFIAHPTAGALVERLTLPGGAYVTNDFDWLARLTATHLRSSAHTLLNAHGYALNDAHQRTRQTRLGAPSIGSAWENFIDYTYDPLGQLKTALGQEYGGTTNRLQEQFRYTYDAAGNLSNRVANVLTNVFAVNSLNELTTVTRTTNFTLAGFTTIAASSVTVNGSTATRYADNTFAKDWLALVDGNNTFTAVATDSNGRGDTNAVTLSLPASISFAYDLNGNMITNGVRVMEYDDENQLSRITESGVFKSEFTYDGQLRLRVSRDYEWRNGSWVLTNETRRVYDGLLMVQERDQFGIPTLSYTRGPDLSGSLQGAGGIGGLLALTHNSALNIQHFHYHSDGNGNVTALMDASQQLAAQCQFDPYGNIISLSGPQAGLNRLWFSSKELHGPSGLYYYTYRWYAPDLQRWVNRDPLGESGAQLIKREQFSKIGDGANLYLFVKNAPLEIVDAFGLLGGGRGAGSAPTGGPPSRRRGGGGRGMDGCPNDHDDCVKSGGKFIPRYMAYHNGDMDACITAEARTLRDGANAVTIGVIGGLLGPAGAIIGGVAGGVFVPLMKCTEYVCKKP